MYPSPRFGARGAVLATVSVFVRQQKNSSEVENYEKYLTLIISNNFCSKRKRVPKLLLGRQNWVTTGLGGREPKLSARETLATSGAGVVCHIVL